MFSHGDVHKERRKKNNRQFSWWLLFQVDVSYGDVHKEGRRKNNRQFSWWLLFQVDVQPWICPQRGKKKALWAILMVVIVSGGR